MDYAADIVEYSFLRLLERSKHSAKSLVKLTFDQVRFDRDD